jgi:tetratricopeptide (TPR) repeat protein
MRGRIVILQWVCFAVWVGFPFPSVVWGQSSTNQNSASGIRIQAVEGKVEYMRAGAQVWETAHTNVVIFLNAGDRVRIAESSRLTLLLSDNSVAVFKENTEFVLKEATAKTRSRFNLLQGFLYFLHRDRPADLDVETQTASAVVRGTEFGVEAKDNRTVLTVFDGEVELIDKNANSILLQNLEQGEVEIGKSPLKRPVLNAINIIQWILFYPGVLEDGELELTEGERSILSESLDAYRSGDLLNALYKYPPGRKPGSEAEKVYLAAVFLAVGQVENAEELLNSIRTGNQRSELLANVIRQLIAAVKLQNFDRQAMPELASEWLAESYYRQAKSQLESALEAARHATAKSPAFGYAWARVAELQFSFGHINRAKEALETALRLSPRNAQAISLKGFILAAENKTSSAIVTFDDAISIDPGLGNAWLGRGLCRIKRGDAEGGRKDLLVAAASEPHRGFTRSYLGKAYANERDFHRAGKELELAKSLDDKDPTAWLYSALLKEQQNKINDAIRDLEKSQELNTNRIVYRSQFLLDQDQAVRSANLARIYRDAGMIDWSAREAGRAVADDYGNYSAHLFLASSYDQLRDPNRINLRYETPAEAEYLIANLLAPVGAGPLSQNISQQEYSRLLERDRLGLISFTEYLSRGAWTQNGSVYGTFGNSSVNLEEFYRTDPGQRINNDFEESEFRIHFKQQITLKDSLYLRFGHYESAGGDLYQVYDPNSSYTEGGPNSLMRFEERQDPTVVFGYHREWAPGSHSLLVAGLFHDTYELNDPQAASLLKGEFGGMLGSVQLLNIHQLTKLTTDIYGVEAQETFESPSHNTIVGARGQWGTFGVNNLHYDALNFQGLFPEPLSQDFDENFSRWSIYGYHHWEIVNHLLLVGGLSYEQLIFPENFRSAPMMEGQEEVDRFLPKAGFISNWKNTSIRGAYTRSLAGASLDQSFRLEPTQVAGFNQAFRSIIPESVAGSNAGARFETYDLSVEQRFDTGTYLAVAGQILYSQVPRTVGAYTLDLDVSDFAFPSEMRQELDYRERSAIFTVDQLIADPLTAGIQYRLTESRLNSAFPEVTQDTNPGPPYPSLEFLLHQLRLYLNYNHPSGFFGQIQSRWYLQQDQLDGLPNENIWQFDIYAGYRFLQRRGELTIGLLNATDQDYRLHPLTIYNEFPRERTFLARLRLNF